MKINWVDVFGTVESENELITATEDYIDFVVDEYDMDIDVSYIIDYEFLKERSEQEHMFDIIICLSYLLV